MSRYKAISPAANRWQSGFISEFSSLGKPFIQLGHVYEPLWPKGKARPGSKNDFDFRYRNVFIPYWNIPLLRDSSLISGYVYAFKEIYERLGRPTAIVSYNPSPQNIATGLYAQEKYGIPWIDICADSYGMDLNWADYPKGAKRAAGHLFLSHYAFRNAPFSKKLHLDGGVSEIKFNPVSNSENWCKPKKAILYSGMMSKWGGVDFLLQAFELIKDPDLELWICGHGDNQELKATLNRDSRIKYYGLVDEETLKKMCKNAAVLVNPRPSDIPGNSMNFPSKVLEYLSYGKPLVSTWTAGLSEEYRKVLLVLREETRECFADTLKEVLAWTEEQRIMHAENIMEFLQSRKMWSMQVKRFMDWMDKELLV